MRKEDSQILTSESEDLVSRLPKEGEASSDSLLHHSKRQVDMLGATVIQFCSKYFNIAVQLLITAVLARLISPDDFGMLAIVVVFLTFFNMFADMGVGVAIVQFRDLSERDIGALFVFSMLLCIVLAGGFCAVSPFIALAFGQNELAPLCCLASLALLFNTLNMVPNGLLLRDKDFASIGARLVVTTIVSGGAAIALALAGWGCYALVIQYVASAIAVFTWNLIRHPIRELNRDFITPLKQIFSYSAFQFGFGFINYFSRNLDSILIGGFMGTAALGYYDKAYKLTTYPIGAISGVVASVVQPYMAEYQDNPDKIFDVWMHIQKLISLVAAPIAAIFFCAAPEIINIMYGDQWGSSIPLFRALAISVYFQMIGSLSGAFFQSLGKTALMFQCGLLNSLLTFIALLGGLILGNIEALAWLVAVAFCLHLAGMAFFLIWRGFGKRVTCLLGLLPEMVIGVLSAGVGAALGHLLPDEWAWQLGGKLLGVLCVVFALYVLTGQFRHLKQALHGLGRG